MPDTNDVLALTPEQIAALSYEQARDLLDSVVAALEDSSLPLAELMKLWAAGEQIAKVCEAQLAAASQQIDEASSR